MIQIEDQILTSFHAWLIRQRKYCGRCSDLKLATTVRRFNGKDLCLCAEHAKRLDAVRQSEAKQPQPISEQPVMDWLQSLPKEEADQMRNILALMNRREEREERQSHNEKQP